MFSQRSIDVTQALSKVFLLSLLTTFLFACSSDDQEVEKINSVTLTSININPVSTTITIDSTLKYSAVGTYSDTTTKNISNVVVWQSSESTVAVFGNGTTNDGIVTAVGAGNTLISASYQNASISTTLTVSPALTLVTVVSSNGNSAVEIDAQLSLSASGGTAPYSWSVNNENASVDSNSGVITGALIGTVIATATDSEGYSGSLSITVNPITLVLQSITVSPLQFQLISGDSIQLQGIATYTDSSTKDITDVLNWKTSDNTKLTFSNITPGLAHSVFLKLGVVNISATLANVTSLTFVEIVPPPITITTTVTPLKPLGPIAPMQVTGGTAPYTWRVDNINLATIDNNGVLTPLKIGPIVVTATDADGFEGSAEFRVLGAVLDGLFTDAALQSCVNNYASANGFTTADEITTLDYACVGSFGSAKIVSLAGLEKLTRLQSLNLRSNSIIDISALTNLVNLTYLEISDNNIATFTGLAGLTKLTELYLYFNIFSANTDLASLSNLVNLKYLNLANSGTKPNSPGLTSANLTALSNLPTLLSLVISTHNINNLDFLANLTSLTNLDLRLNSIISITPLTNLNNLKFLDLSSNASLIDIDALSSLASLGNLNLSYNTAIDPNIFTTTFSSPSSFFTLYTLRIVGMGVSDLSSISNLTNLTSFYANNNGIVDITPLASLSSSLRYVSLNNNLISDITSLSSFKNLRQLELNSNQVTDLSALANLANLEAIYFNNNIITNTASFSVLGNRPKLISMGLQKTGISDLSVLSGLPKMYSLDLDSNNIIDVSPLSSLTTLNYLYLNNNKIGGAGVGNVDQLSTLTQARTMTLAGVSNRGMSCNELAILLAALNPGVVNLTSATNGSTCTNP